MLVNTIGMVLKKAYLLKEGEKHYLNNTSIQSNKTCMNVIFYNLISQAPKLRLIFHPYITHFTQ